MAGVACGRGPWATVDSRPAGFVTRDDDVEAKLGLLAGCASQAGIRSYLQPDCVLATARYWSRFGWGSACEPLEIVRDAGGIHVIVKPLKDGGHAVAVFNESNAAKDVTVTPKEIGLKAGGSYTLRDLWAHTETKGDGSIKTKLEPHATVMYRISP